jgi:D-alanyl-D-alanine carboxypeptidase (penicillin-binding protein 5/6)
MASVTKVMTALLVLESGNLDREIGVPKAAVSYAWKYGGEAAALYPGDVLTAQELLEALLLPSGADAAYTLADAYGPGLNAFVARMNATAAQMGMKHTQFTSPDGLPYPTETSTYSTPSDLVTLGLAAMRYPAFRSVVDLRFYHLPKGRGHHEYWWDNTDALIGSYQGAVGIKTGYTDAAGHCLLFEAVRNGRALIGVVLDSPATGPAAGAQDAARMLNWGFSLRPVSAGPQGGVSADVGGNHRPFEQMPLVRGVEGGHDERYCAQWQLCQVAGATFRVMATSSPLAPTHLEAPLTDCAKAALRDAALRDLAALPFPSGAPICRSLWTMFLCPQGIRPMRS